MPEGTRPDPPAHVARFTVSGDWESARWANVFWVRNGGFATPTAGDFQSATADFLSAYNSSFRQLMGIRCIVRECTALYYGVSGGALDAVAAASQTGNQGGENLPASAAIVIGWRVQAHYRGGHPRTYIPGVTTDQLEDTTTFKSSYVDATRDVANFFLNAVNDIHHGDFNSVHLGTVSFVHRKEWRTPPVFRDYIPGAAFCDSRVDSQRRRLGRDR